VELHVPLKGIWILKPWEFRVLDVATSVI
jgi:hypothetical protein